MPGGGGLHMGFRDSVLDIGVKVRWVRVSFLLGYDIGYGLGLGLCVWSLLS